MRKMIGAIVLTGALATTAGATPWHIMGPRAMGMGGAQVAIAQGPLASYWNPAGLGQLYNRSGVAVPFGARFAFTGDVIQGGNDLYQVNKDCQELSQCNAGKINDALTRLGQPGNGALLDMGLGVAVKIKRVVVFVHGLGYAGVSPQVDMVNITAAQGAGGTNILENDSKLILRGGNFTEIGVGYGRELGETGLIVGGNLKGIVGRIGYDELNIIAEDPGSGSFSDYDDSTKSSFQPGIDLGFLWDMRETFPGLPMRPRAGLVARNINAPKFKQPETAKAAGQRDKYTLQGQMRAGFAISPFKFWHVAMDLDLTDNLAPINGYRSRYLSLGTEINVINHTAFNIPLRAGILKNVSKQSDAAAALTMGVGLNLLHVNIDLSGMVSPKSTKVQSEGETQSIPNNFGASAQVAVLFGGKDEGGRK